MEPSLASVGLAGWGGSQAPCRCPGDGPQALQDVKFNTIKMLELGTRHGDVVLRKSSKHHLEVFLLARSLVVQLSSMGPTSNLSPQEKSLGADISILGGNRTGIFVQWVKPGSQVEKAGLKEGCRLIEVGLGMGSRWGFAVQVGRKECGVSPGTNWLLASFKSTSISLVSQSCSLP